jgi:hypothetical protein
LLNERQPKLGARLGHCNPEKVFGVSGPEKIPPKLLFLKPNLLIIGMIAQVFLKKYFFPHSWPYQSFGDQALSGWEAYGPQGGTGNDAPKGKAEAPRIAHLVSLDRRVKLSAIFGGGIIPGQESKQSVKVISCQ